MAQRTPPQFIIRTRSRKLSETSIAYGSQQGNRQIDEYGDTLVCPKYLICLVLIGFIFSIFSFFELLQYFFKKFIFISVFCLCRLFTYPYILYLPCFCLFRMALLQSGHSYICLATHSNTSEQV